MILYVDTSALVKLFVVEAHSDRVRQAISRARLIATHQMADLRTMQRADDRVEAGKPHADHPIVYLF
jgi:predicted nucleic acid-binding protein